MQANTPQNTHLTALSRIRRIRGQPGDLYEIIFVDQHDQIVVPLTEWYHLRKELGPRSTRETYLTCLLPFLSFLIERECPWNAPPERLRPLLVAFHRDRLSCQMHPGNDHESMRIVPTRDTPLSESTLRVLRAALRDFYFVMKDAGLYAFPNPLSSDALVALKRAHVRALANSGAPDHAGIREETHERSRRLPSAFLRHPDAQGWKPNLRKELTDVRVGIHAVLDAMIDSSEVSLREKAILELLRTTGARLHEIVSMTVGGYRNEGIAGQASVVSKGSYGREVKTIYFAHNPRVEQALTAYLGQMRPLHDPHGRTNLAEIGDREPFFLTERKTPSSVKSFYWHWYHHYARLRDKCPVRFSPHDIRHLFVTEYLITLRIACGAGTDYYDAEKYQREREAFGSTVMYWRSPKTIDIYDQSRNVEGTLAVLGTYQQGLAQRRYVTDQLAPIHEQAIQEERRVREEYAIVPPAGSEMIWLQDAETLAWVKKQQQQADSGL